MSPILLAATSLATLPADFWILCAVCSLISLAIGFASGCFYAKRAVQRTFRQARQKVTKLFALVLETLDSAQEVCAMLKNFPHLTLTPEQTQRLSSRQATLIQTVDSIVAAQLELQNPPEEDSSDKDRPETFNIEWVRTPEDLGTKIPTRAAFESNLLSLLELGDEYGIGHGVLLVRIDKLEHLKSRFGTVPAEKLLKKLCSLLCVSLRDEDLACRYSTDCFGLLMPDVDAETALQLARKIREKVRNHHFRLEEGEAEVLVTASFGLTVTAPGDSPDLVLNRAGQALSRSQRRGRNQLHVHDGAALAYCNTR